MKKLERRLGLSAVVAISISSMIGSGIFVLPGLAITLTGPSLWLAYLASALCVLPAAISKAELATAMPTSGGTYVYIERTFGPFAGTVAGLGLWLSLLLKASFALMGFGAYLGVFTNFPMQTVSLTLLAVIVMLNILGVGKVSWTMMLVVGICISSLMILNLIAFPTVDQALLTPHFLKGFDGFVAATAMVFVSYAGVTKIAAIAEEIKEPDKNLPKGILFSLFIVTILYSSVSFFLSANIPYSELSGNLKPIYTLAQKISGPTVSTIIALIAILTMTSMANAGILAASRFPFALSRDKLLPAFLGKLNQKYLTPVMSIIFSGIVVATALLTLDVTKMAKLASAFMIMVYLLENITLIILRESRVQWYKPEYKTKFYPYIQILGIVSGAGLLIPMGAVFVKGILFIGIPGLLIYFYYGRHQTNRKGVIGIRAKRTALLHDKDEAGTSGNAHPYMSVIEEMDLSRDASVVTAIFGKERSPEALVEKGISLTESGSIEVAHITEVPEQTDLKDLAIEQPKLRSLRRRILAMALEKKLPITFDPIVTHDLSKTVLDISLRMHCKWLLVEWGGKSRGTFTIHNPVGWLKNHLHCHLGVFRDAGVRYIRKIMVYVKPGENEEFLLDTADHLAQTHKADITLTMLYDPKANNKKEIEDKLEQLVLKCNSVVHTNLVESAPKMSSLIEHSFKFDLLVFGASEHNYISDLIGSDDDRLIAHAACSVLCIQKSNHEILKPFE